MNRKSNIKQALFAIGALTASISLANASIVFEATFTNSLDGFATTVDPSGLITLNPNSVESRRTGDNSGANVTNVLDRSINTTGFENITLDFTAFQTSDGSFEGDQASGGEFLRVEVDSGSGFVTVFEDGGVLDELGNNQGVAAGSSFSPATIALDPAADNGSIDVRITLVSGFTENNAGNVQPTAEIFNLDNFLISGDILIPEPSTALLLGLGGLAVISHRRRKRLV